MSTPTVQTAGVVPGVICYLSDGNGVWSSLAQDISEGVLCAVIEDGTGYYGSALLPDFLVNVGWTIRIILFWSES